MATFFPVLSLCNPFSKGIGCRFSMIQVVTDEAETVKFLTLAQIIMIKKHPFLFMAPLLLKV
jgi:hypothetical protein